MLNIRKLVKDYHDSARSSAELLPWMALWDEQTVCTLDQGLLAVFAYEGIDAEGSTDSAVDASVFGLERAFAGFTTGNTVWSIVDRRRTDTYPEGEIPNAVSERINQVWRQQITQRQFQNFYSLAVHQRASAGASAYLDAVDVIVKEENASLGKALVKAGKAQLSLRARQTLDERRMAAAQAKLEARCAELQQGIGSLGLKRIAGEQLLAYLHERANPASRGRRHLALPRTLMYLQFLLANDQVDRLPTALRFSNQRTAYVGVVSLKGWPDDATVPGRLDALTNIDGEITICHTFRFLHREVAERSIKDIAQYNQSRAIPFFHRIITSLSDSPPTRFNPGRLALEEDAKEALREMYTDGRVFGHHNLTVLCYGDTLEEMEAVREQVHSALRDSSFTGLTERMHQLAAWTQTLPGQWGASVRWSNVSFGNVADLMPVRTLWSGPETCAHFSKELKRGPVPPLVSLPTDSGVPFHWDPWENGAGHTTIIGPSRNGKSVLVNFLLSQFRRYEPCRTIVFDKDYTCKVATLLQDGEHYDLSPEASGEAALRMSPMGLVSDSRHHAFLIRWISTLISRVRPDRPISPEELDKIQSVLRGMQKMPASMQTLGHLRTEIGVLGRYLDDWVANVGGRGAWFDNPPTNLKLGEHLCFECKRLFDDEVVAELAMSYLFYVVEQQLDDTPTIIYVEEAWFFLQQKDFVPQLNDYARTLPKRNAALWLTTQGLAEITSDERLQTMLANIPNRIYLANPDIQSQADLYSKAMGLNDAQIRRIQYAQRQRDYYIVTRDVARMASVRLPREIVAQVESNSRARQAIERHYATRATNPNWKRDYLEEMTNA